jgi:hypothetical protein
MHHHGRQDVVEVMCNPASQLPDGFHLLRLIKLLLQLIPLCFRPIPGGLIAQAKQKPFLAANFQTAYTSLQVMKYGFSFSLDAYLTLNLHAAELRF